MTTTSTPAPPAGRRMLILLLLGLSFGSAAAAEQLADVVVVAADDDGIPGHAGTIHLLQEPVINDAGEVYFAASISGGTAGSGIFRATGSGLTLLVAQDDPSPDGNGNFDSMPGATPFVNDAGAIAFDHFMLATLGGLLDATTIFAGRGGDESFSVVVRGNQLVPDGAGDRFFIGMIPLDFNASGEVAFRATTQEDVAGIWRGDGSPNSLTRVVGEGDADPSGEGVMTAQFPPLVSVMNGAGEVAFIDVVLTPDGSLVGIYRGSDPASLVEIARQGDGAPSGDGVMDAFFAIAGLSINDSGEVAFLSRLTGTSAGIADDVALFRGSGAATVELVRKGDPMPDGNGSFLLGPSQLPLIVNDRGGVLFHSLVSGAAGGATEGLFLAGDEGVEKIARVNEPAPGGGVFESFGSALGLNDDDQVAFHAVVDDGGFFGVEGIFVYDDGLLVSVAREGDEIPGFGELTAVDTSTGLQGEPRSSMRFLNDLGQVAFRFFAGGDSGVAIATPDVCTAQEEVQLSDVTIFGSEEHEACDRLVAADVLVAAGGDLTLRAGGSVVLASGFAVAEGGKLRVVVD